MNFELKFNQEMLLIYIHSFEQGDPDVVIVDAPPRPCPVKIDLDESFVEEDHALDATENDHEEKQVIPIE